MYVEQQIADSVNNSYGDMTYNSNNLYCIQLTRWPLANRIRSLWTTTTDCHRESNVLANQFLK